MSDDLVISKLGQIPVGRISFMYVHIYLDKIGVVLSAVVGV